MAAVSVSINIQGLSPADLQRFQELPQQIGRRLAGARTTLDAVRNGTAEGDPVAGLFSTLSTLAEGASHLPSIEGLVHPVQDLVGRLPAGAVADIRRVSGSLDAFLGLFGPLKDALLSGNLEGGLQTALSRSLEFAGNLFHPSPDIQRLETELSEFFRLFRSLLGWQSSVPRPEEVAQLLSRGLIGVPLDLLANVSAAHQVVVDSLASLELSGHDADLWRDMAAHQLSLWQQIDGRVSVGASVDWPALAADLRAARTRLVEVTAARDRLLALSVSTLNRFQVHGLAELAQAIRAVPKIQPLRLQPVFDGLRRQLRGMVDELDAFNPTEERARLAGRALVDYLLELLEHTPLGQLRIVLVNFQQRLVEAIESLPFQSIAREAQAALRHVADEIDVLDPGAIRKPIHDFFGEVRSKIDSVASATVAQSLRDLWQQVEQTVNSVSAEIESVRATIDGATNGIRSFVEHAQPALSGISSSAATIDAQLEAFDLAAAAAEVIDALHQIRDTISQIDVSVLPEAAVSAVKSAAETLRNIDVAGTVTGPLNDALAAIDPTPALNAASAALSPVVAQLKSIDPISLSADLDKPVDELLAALEEFGPERLRETIDTTLKPVRDAINGIDFAGLLAPLTRAYGELKAKVDGLLDPDPIFRPLEDLFKPVVDAIDAVEPTRLVGMLDPHGEALATNTARTLGPPGPIAAAGGILRDAFPPAAEAQEELFGFRPGDVLLPLIDLHRKLVQAVDSLAETVLEPAARQLHQSVAAPLRDVDPVRVLDRLTSALASVRAEFDASGVSSRLADAAAAFHAAAGKISAAARLDLSAGDRAIAVQVFVDLPGLDPLHLVPDAVQTRALSDASLRIEAALDLTELRTAFAGFRGGIESLLPGFLSGEDLGASQLRDALRALDPAPIRREINDLFDQVGQKVVALEERLMQAFDEVALGVEERLLPLTLSGLVTLAQNLHSAVKDQLLAFSPGAFKDEVRLLFDVVKRELSVLDPSFLVEEFNALRRQVLDSLDALVSSLLPDPAPFHQMEERLAALKPSRILGPLVAALKPLTDLVATLDPQKLFEPIVTAIARIREQLPKVIADVEAAFDDMLAAFPEGGVRSVSASVSVQASAG